MFRKLVLGAMGVALAGVMAFGGMRPTYANATPGVGPAQAVALMDGWQKLDVGATTWYAFDYLGDSSQITVLMQVVPSTGASFTIWTPEQVAQYAAGKAVQPVGAGSPTGYGVGTHLWSGNFNMPGRYYVVVTQSGSEAAYYTLAAAGSGVMSIAPAKTAAATVETATTTAAATTATVAATAGAASMDGATPGEAFTIPAYDVPVEPGQSIWHAFHYAGTQSQILVSLNARGQSGFSFKVYTPEQVSRLGQGQTVSAVGLGAHDAYAAGDLIWSGNFPQAGIYYVKVTNSNSYATTYTLQISGSGVW